MLEKKNWMNLTYLFMVLIVCFTIFELSTLPSVSQMSTPQDPSYYLYTNASSVYSQPVELLSHADYGRLIDLNFTFNILNLACNDSSPLLLVLVHSAPRNYAKRRTIRETWGKAATTRDVRIVFMTGMVSSARLQDRLDAESSLYQDMVQGSFTDTYRNLTYKHVMVFKYAVYHCPQAKYILKTDDDVFVNVPLMVNFLTNDLSPYGASNLLLCEIKEHSRVLRSFRSKWRVSFSEYPSKYYPKYCLGWTLMYSPDVLFALYRESQKAEYFWIDDIHMTGTLVKRIHVGHTSMHPLVISRPDFWSITRSYADSKNMPVTFDNSTRPFLFGLADLHESEIRALWNFVQVQSIPKSILKYID